MSRESLETRDRILKAAWALLEKNQGKGVRMADIAREAGISRQALYLHFKKRSELLIEVTRYVDLVNGVDDRLLASRTATTGIECLNAYIEAWGNYIPEIYSIGKALLAMKDVDEDAAAAWRDRMQAVRHGCVAAVTALQVDNQLKSCYDEETATDVLWTLLSVRNWEQLTQECGWSQQQYIVHLQTIAETILVQL